MITDNLVKIPVLYGALTLVLVNLETTDHSCTILVHTLHYELVVSETIVTQENNATQ